MAGTLEFKEKGAVPIAETLAGALVVVEVPADVVLPLIVAMAVVDAPVAFAWSATSRSANACIAFKASSIMANRAIASAVCLD